LGLTRVPGARLVPQVLARRRDGLVLFESWRGLYADNPRAISERLHERRPDLPQAWVVDERAEHLVPEHAQRVRPHTTAYLRAFGRATHVVSNIELPGYFRKRPGTRYLQTWHGTPLKRIGFDVRRPDGVNDDGDYLRTLARDVAKWDDLLSPNPFSTEVFERAFRYRGRILESGYPRNDALAAGAGRPAARAALGLRDDERAILYAPTWRDSRTFDLRLDVAALAERLGGGHRLLLRLHPHARAALPAADWVLDVSEHPDVAELCLAADVLVTDYSSVMFDFAVTGKPIVLFAYDLAHYRDELRGLYLDLAEVAPGPVAGTTAELAECLARDLHGEGDAYRRFTGRFCALEDGRAADRVIDAVF
jgi:CDP-glycerol glycerophosphotransferase